MTHELPKLGYAYDALEPYIDAKTMEIHYTKHHKTYVDKLNAALERYPLLQKKKVEDLIKELNSKPQNINTAIIEDEINTSASLPSNVKMAVRNHGGGHANHSFFWQILKKNTKLSGKIEKEIVKRYGSFDDFKKLFAEAAMNRFGSGWAWLVMDNGKLEIISTANQDSPLMEGKKPVLGLDVWEHSYYIKHNSNRAAYVEAFWNVVNWDQVEENFEKK